MPLSAKTVKDRTIRMAANISSQKISDINSAPGYSIACDGSKDISDVEQISLFCRYVNSTGLKEEFIEIIPLKSQTRGKDICAAVLDCLKTKEINTTHFRVVNRAGLFGSGSGLTFRKTSGLFRTRYDAYKQTFNKQNYSVTLYLFYVP